jgi:hypothetical protein
MKGGSFKGLDKLSEAIVGFEKEHNKKGQEYKWRKRMRGTQLSTDLSNFID